MQPHRISGGGLIDRTRPLRFHFDGVAYVGQAGDTLASALLANGVRLVGRSFKYHRPRGILSAGPEEPNALVELREGASREPNTRATTIELFEGLRSRSQNRFPNLGFDLMAVTGLLAPVFAAGFYYKTFMWPAAFWERVYEPLIRRTAGLGRASGLADPDCYDKQNAFADLLVIGAGPAGITAALEAARGGARVILAEQDFALGGRLLSDRRSIDGKPASTWLAAAVAELRGMATVRVLTRTTVVGVFDGGSYAAIERIGDHLGDGANAGPRQRLWRIVSAKSVLATGAIERPLVFGGNDLPGVMLAGAVRTYLNRFAVRPGSRAVVFSNNDDGAATIADLVAGGIPVAGLVDSRANLPDALREQAAALRIPVFANSTVRRALGGNALRSVVLGGQAEGTRLRCDVLAMSGGWNPVVHLASQQGGKPVWSDAIAAFVPGPTPPGMRAAGAAAGDFLLADALGSQRRTGAESAAGRTGAESASVEPLWQVAGARGKCFVDFQNDVTDADVAIAAREGFTAVEHLKRYTTLGMATDQGKTSNVIGLAIMAGQTGRSIAQTGTTVFRPPFTPVAIGAMAGSHVGMHWRPRRLTPAHEWAASHGAVFIEAGEWLRASHFPAPGESLESAVTREVRMVREACGFCDVGTLGKIDVQGPDAAAFLDFVYANLISTLAPGRVRYGLMLREDGFAFDDGVVACLAARHFLLTTTTANAARVIRHLDLCHQVLRPELDLCIEPVTDQWAQFALSGPRARDVLRAIVAPEVDVGDSALPPMTTMRATLRDGVPARLFRVSFSGELAYEIAVGASDGAALADALQRAGAAPYGLEALNVLRLEKGHLVGAELNGQTTAADLGLGRMLSRKKDFIGRALSQRPALLDPDRASLVGLRPCAPGATLQAGSHLVPRGMAATAANDQGHVTSAAFSPTLGHWIGLALLDGGARRIGEIVRAVNPLQGMQTEVEIVPTVFVDPEGTRQHA